MRKSFNIGDTVLCTDSGVVGKVLYYYTPTSCEEQTMVMTKDRRRYHAPTTTWVKYDETSHYEPVKNDSQISIRITNVNQSNLITLSNNVMKAASDKIEEIRNSNIVKIINGRT